MNFPQNAKILETLLVGLGLNDKEAKIYRLLLEVGQGKPSTIATKSGLKRGITYAILYDLEKKGLTSRLNKEGKIYFRPEDPQKLLELVEHKKQEAETLEASLKRLIPKLSSQYKMAVGRPTVRYFEGEEGIKTIFSDIYGPKKEPVYGCVDLEAVDQTFPSYITEKLIPLRIKNRVQAISFIADSPQAREISHKDKLQIRQTILLDKKQYPLPAEIDVYEDKIALLSLKNNQFLGVLIENPELTESLKSIFRLAFNLSSLKRQKRG